MAEPSTTAIAIAAGTITLTGTVFGVEYQSLLSGFFGGLCWCTYVPALTKRRIAATLATSALLAGYFTPLFAIGLTHYVAWVRVMPDAPLRITSAAAIGLLAQSLLPVLIQRVVSYLAPKG